ncbi:winged helix-turn-helix domain-containing protein [Gaopeijia maritima]|uniref:Transcriptional regulator n=1 Tax=Gaopeijia maritima TaxID=3119007 RepID=A0ABU9E4N9_9BACT
MAADPARSHGTTPPRPTGPEKVMATPATDTGTNPTELDQLIHGRVRLGIVSALAVHDRLSFTELKELLETSDGNLSAHARRLEEGEYLVCTKTFEGRVPHTEYRLTDRGRRALTQYLDHMEALIERVRDS